MVAQSANLPGRVDPSRAPFRIILSRAARAAFRALAAADVETAEEADDFEVDEDYDPRFEESIYEAYFEAKSKRAADVAARQAEANRTASAGLISESSAVSSGQMPTGASSSSVVEPRPGGPSVAPSDRPGSNESQSERPTRKQM